MKKQYSTPQTGTIQLIGNNAIMVGSGNLTGSFQYSEGKGGGMR
jgi:hypothetical protein